MKDRRGRAGQSWAVAAAGWLLAGAAAAVVLTPTIATDELTSPGAGCSLREAVLQANRNVVIDPACGAAGESLVADTIALAAFTTYVLSLGGEDDLGEVGDLDIEDDLEIHGSGSAVEAAPLLGDRVLDVHGGRIQAFDMAVRGGSVTLPVAHGGGIRNAGHLTLTRCVVAGNRAAGGALGGGIYSIGPLELVECTVRQNLATGGSAQGGGIYAAADLLLLRTHLAENVARGLPGAGAGGGGVALGGGAQDGVRLIDSWFEANLAEGGSDTPSSGIGIAFGGGLSALGVVTIVGCTFSANVARGGDAAPGASSGAAHGIGGAIFSFGGLSVANSTFSGNSTVPGEGGGFERARSESLGAIFVLGPTALDSVTVTGSSAVGIYNSTGQVTLRNTLVALQSSGADCGGRPVLSADFNLDSDGSCDLTGANDQPAVAADAVGLGPLSANGGFGPTHALLLSSAAFERGETALDLDQRGVPRPQFARDDVGAVEQAGFAAPVAIPSLTDAALGGLALSLTLATLVAFRLSRR